jgi:hypothetical protein
MGTKKKSTPSTQPVMHDAHVLFDDETWTQLTKMAKDETRRPAVMARLLVIKALASEKEKEIK